MTSTNLYKLYHIHSNLYKKYNKTLKDVNSIIINSVIFNMKTHYVSLFKDYLIYDDITGFLTMFYPFSLSMRLIKENLTKEIPSIKFSSIEISNIIKKNKDTKKGRMKEIITSRNANNIVIYSNILSKINESNTETKDTVIDNVNANDDITYSIDLKINKEYDYKNLDRHCDFVEKGKNNDTFEMLRKKNSIKKIEIRKKKTYIKKALTSLETPKISYNSLFIKGNQTKKTEKNQKVNNKKRKKELCIPMSSVEPKKMQLISLCHFGEHLTLTTHTSTPNRNIKANALRDSRLKLYSKTFSKVVPSKITKDLQKVKINLSKKFSKLTDIKTDRIHSTKVIEKVKI